MNVFNKCTLSQAEECDASSVRVIRSCFKNKLSAKSLEAAKAKNCHRTLNDASIRCMTSNWSRNMHKLSSDAIRELPMPQNRGQREIEFS